MLCTVLLFTSCFETVSTVDKEPPVLVLQSKVDTIYVGMKWSDSGSYSATDNSDGDITGSVSVSGTVNTGKPGKYSLVYSVSDKAGNETEEEKTVIVKLSPNTVAWYPFLKNCFDFSGNKLNGSTRGTCELAPDRSDNVQSAYAFKGNNYIEVPYSARLDLTDSFSISIWAKSNISGDAYKNVAGSSGFILNMGFGAERDYAIYYHPSLNGICFRYNATNVVDSIVNIQEWHHYAMTFSGTELCGYVDGKLIGKVKVGKGKIDDHPLKFGCESKSTQRMWNGYIDDAIIYNNVLTSDQIDGLYRSPAFTPDTTASVDTSTTTKDPKVPSGLSATITGTSGNLSLHLSWNTVPGAFSYGIYYAEGKTVSTNDYYRVSTSNYKTFTSELTEGKEYTFVVFSTDGTNESGLSAPLTVLFKPQ